VSDVHRFRATIEAGRGGGAFVRVPFDVEKVFGKKRVPVAATIDGEPYRGGLMRMGTTFHLLGVEKAIRLKIGKQVGDTVDITVQEDTAPRVIAVPPDLQRALAKAPKARAFFDGLSYTHRKEYVRWIEEAKRDETRASRVEQTIACSRRGRRDGSMTQTAPVAHIAQPEKARRFRALHARPGAFVIPNPWDVGSAKLLEGLGFEALATTSSGFANAVGRTDGGVTKEEVIAHCRSLCESTNLPVSADLENGFADAPDGVAATIRAAADAGLAGASIEDCGGLASRRIYDFALAVERVQAAAEAARALPFPFTLTARAENLLRGIPDLDDTIRRLQAYEDAGADVLFAPGLTTLDQVRTVTSSVGKPVNVLVSPLRHVSLAELADAGAKRISVGGALARAAMTAAIAAANEMRERGTFTWMGAIASPADVNRLITGRG
jgi:2-methylisocitrate lyase-like PEP mutase family enzyme